MKFSEIIGNRTAINDLRRMVDSGQIPHALLISGPSGIGKMLAARALISYLNCENPVNGDSCGRCPSCRRIDAGNNPDIHYFFPIYKIASQKLERSIDYAEEWSQFLKESPYMDLTRWMELMDGVNSQPRIYVNDAEEISRIASLSSYSDKYKIIVIWLPERMQPEAANKILKILEEPYEDTVFICISNDPGSILPTVYSRLQRVDMKRPTTEEIEIYLKNRNVDTHILSSMARLSEGSFLKASQLASDQGETGEFGELFRNIMRNAYARKASVLRNYADDMAAMGREKSLRLLAYFSRMTRENFISNLCVPPLNVMTDEETAFSTKFAPFINVNNVEGIMTAIEDARRDISRNANSKLVWFDFMIILMILLRKKTA
ncbi:MAG: DNA polymerase III subunit delta [Muribaculaceae bacterium]|nr:DNA polymerase III subunit delta [Muribaculaceae bacterium]